MATRQSRAAGSTQRACSRVTCWYRRCTPDAARLSSRTTTWAPQADRRVNAHRAAKIAAATPATMATARVRSQCIGRTTSDTSAAATQITTTTHATISRGVIEAARSPGVIRTPAPPEKPTDPRRRGRRGVARARARAVTLASVGRRHVSEHLLDVRAAPRPRGPIAHLAGHRSTHRRLRLPVRPPRSRHGRSPCRGHGPG